MTNAQWNYVGELIKLPSNNAVVLIQLSCCFKVRNCVGVQYGKVKHFFCSVDDQGKSCNRGKREKGGPVEFVLLYMCLAPLQVVWTCL